MIKGPSIIWFVGQMCSGSCFLALLPIVAFILKFYSVPSFLPGSPRFHIFILPHPGEERWSLLCVWGEEIGRERGKEESERKEREEMEGEQSASLYQLLLSRNHSKSLLLPTLVRLYAYPEQFTEVRMLDWFIAN